MSWFIVLCSTGIPSKLNKWFRFRTRVEGEVSGESRMHTATGVCQITDRAGTRRRARRTRKERDATEHTREVRGRIAADKELLSE
jgi:hypothetical protein